MHACGRINSLMQCLPISRSVEESSPALNFSLHFSLNPSIRNLALSFPSRGDSEFLNYKKKIQEKVMTIIKIYSIIQISSIEQCHNGVHLYIQAVAFHQFFPCCSQFHCSSSSSRCLHISSNTLYLVVQASQVFVGAILFYIMHSNT